MKEAHDKKHYTAFISYSTMDERWARWLWHKLEYYPVPSNLRKDHPNLPKNLRPIFWYKQDLSGTHLQQSLQKELNDSQYLIVICSPAAAQSEWVDKEVSYFIELGRVQHIIPFIVDGQPHAANPTEECFPPALRNLPKNQELRGIDVRRAEGKKHAFVDIVATLLDVRFNDLWQRHQRRRRRIILRFLSATLLILLLIILQMLYKMPRIEYYADYVDQWGVPTGVVPIDKEQKEHSFRSYLFTYHRAPLSAPNRLKWQLEKVAYINSANAICEHEHIEYISRSAIMTMTYSEQTGTLTQIQYANAEGNIKYRQDISTYNSIPAAIADLRSASEDMGSGFAQSNTASLEQDEIVITSAIKRFAYKRDALGYITQLTYHSNNDDDLESSKICDINGIYGMQFTRDSLGRVIEAIYIDKNGNITSTKKGVAGYRFSYDNNGSVNSYLFFDMQRQPICNEQHWAYCMEETDTYGNTIKSAYYNEEGELCTHTKGYAQFTIEYDERGNKIQQSFFDEDTLPCMNRAGIAGWKAKYNDAGYCTERSYFDTLGQACIHPRYGYAKVIRKYNILGCCTEETYYGVHDEPCNNRDGYAQVNHTFDLRSNCIETAYFGTFGRPGIFMNCSMIKRKFDSHDRCIEEAYFDSIGRPCWYGIEENKRTRWCGKYNALGHIVEHTYYDAENQLLERITLLYDTRGNTIEIATYDAQGRLKNDNYGIARATFAYDKQGNCIQTTYYDLNGKIIK